jgi:demethylmenaquinone methyltransferase/2-methoxy-6-polyprenyl-1,4-benzoquinol methylase
MATVEQQTRIAPPAETGFQKEQAVQRMFTSIARYYDLNNSVLSVGLHHRWKRNAIEYLVSPPHPHPLPPRERDLILDIGAGTGDLALLAAGRIGTSARIIAADLNYPMLAIGLKKIRRKQFERQIACAQVNAERISARDEVFDAVTTGFCLRNVADLQMALREIYWVLKPGGRLVCLEFSRPTTSWLRRLYDWYSFALLPWIGTKVSGDTTGVYQYLPASIRSFPDQEALAKEMCAAGFKHAEYHNRSGGIVAIHVAVK